MSDAGGSLADRVALVTGASSGIGRSVALELARCRMRLSLVGRDRDRLGSVAEAAGAEAPQVLPLQRDLTRDDDVADIAARLEKEFGRLDALIHCAGEIASGALEDAAVEDLDRLYRANLRGPCQLTRSVLPLLRVGPGEIVFVNSSAGWSARAGVGQFAATQHALRAVADALRAEINADGIRVLSVYPGRTATPRQERIFQREGRSYAPELLMQPEDVASMIASALRLPRTAEVTEIHMRPLLKSY